MKIILLVERESDTEDVAWVVDAADEYTMDEHNGAFPPSMQEKIDKGKGNVRSLVIEIPDGALMRPFRTPTVQGTVVGGE